MLEKNIIKIRKKMINSLINKGNVNEQLTNSIHFFTHILLNKNKDGLYYCQLFFIAMN